MAQQHGMNQKDFDLSEPTNGQLQDEIRAVIRKFEGVEEAQLVAPIKSQRVSVRLRGKVPSQLRDQIHEIAKNHGYESSIDECA